MKRAASPGPDPGAATGASGREPADTEEERAFFETLAAKAHAARGGSESLTSIEFHIVDRWWQKRVPLWRAVEAVDERAALWKPGEAPRHFLKGVDEALGADSGVAGRPASPEQAGVQRPGEASLPAGDLAAGMAERLRAAAGRLPGDRSALRSALFLWAGKIEASGEPGRTSREARKEILARAADSLPPGSAQAIEDLERRRLSGLGATLSQRAFRETLDRLVSLRIFDEAGIAGVESDLPAEDDSPAPPR